MVNKATSVLLKSSVTHEGSIVLVGKSYQSVTQTLLNKKPCGGFAIGSSIEEILLIEFHIAKTRFCSMRFIFASVSFLPTCSIYKAGDVDFFYSEIMIYGVISLGIIENLVLS